MSDETETFETPSLSGTIKLACVALSSPEPSQTAETNSRRQVETLMQEAALSPRVLREAAGLLPRQTWQKKLFFWMKKD